MWSGVWPSLISFSQLLISHRLVALKAVTAHTAEASVNNLKGTSCRLNSIVCCMLLLSLSYQFYGSGSRRKPFLQEDGVWSRMHLHLYSLWRGSPGSSAAAQFTLCVRSSASFCQMKWLMLKMIFYLFFSLPEQGLLWNWSASNCHLNRLFEL